MLRRFKALLAVGLASCPLLLVGCTRVFGDYTRPNPESCVANPALCTAEQICNATTGQCEPRMMNEIPDLASPSPDLNGTCVTNRSMCSLPQLCNFRTGVCETQDCTPDGWCSAKTPTLQLLRAVWVRDLTDVWAVGVAGTVLRWDGADWRVLMPGNAASFTTVSGSSANDVWIGGPGGGIITRFDGTNFSNVPCTMQDGYVTWSFSPTNAWYAGDNDEIFGWNGASWLRITPSSGVGTDFRGAWGSGPSDVWFIGTGSSGGMAARYNGTTLMTQGLGMGNSLYGIYGTNRSDIWVCGNAGGLYRYNGSVWQPQSSLTTTDLYSVYGAAANRYWFVGQGGTIVHFDGTTMQTKLSGTSVDLYGVHGYRDIEIWAVGDAGRLLRHQPRP